MSIPVTMSTTCSNGQDMLSQVIKHLNFSTVSLSVLVIVNRPFSKTNCVMKTNTEYTLCVTLSYTKPIIQPKIDASKADIRRTLQRGVQARIRQKKRKKWGVERGRQSKKDRKREVHPSHCLNLTVTPAWQPMRHLSSVQEIG